MELFDRDYCLEQQNQEALQWQKDLFDDPWCDGCEKWTELTDDSECCYCGEIIEE